MKGHPAAVKLCDITHDGEAEAAARHRFIAALAALEARARAESREPGFAELVGTAAY